MVFSCEKTHDNSSYESNPPKQNSEVIPVSEAIASLDRLMGELYGQTKSLSKEQFSVDVFGGVQTKSGDCVLPDTALYIVNFEQNAGFAILSAQRKLKTEIFCVTESGSLTSQDILDAISFMDSQDAEQTKAMKASSAQSSERTKSSLDELPDQEEVCTDEEEDDFFFDMGEQTVPAIIASSLINQWNYDFSKEDDEYDNDALDNETKADTYAGLPITSAMLETKWHQESPFNNFRSDGYPAGCVAIATAQIIEFNAINHGYDHFTIDNNKQFNWELLLTVCNCSNRTYAGTSEAQNEASKFLQYVGLKKNCKIRYGSDGSWGVADGAKRTFNNIGYKSVKKYLGFENPDRNRVITQLTKGLPLYMGGVASGTSGHAWVLDGTFAKPIYNESGKLIRTDRFLHINWGWRGASDGYYDIGVFDTTKRKEIDPIVDPGTVVSTPQKYTWDYRTITYSL